MEANDLGMRKYFAGFFIYLFYLFIYLLFFSFTSNVICLNEQGLLLQKFLFDFVHWHDFLLLWMQTALVLQWVHHIFSPCCFGTIVLMVTLITNHCSCFTISHWINNSSIITNINDFFNTHFLPTLNTYFWIRSDNFFLTTWRILQTHRFVHWHHLTLSQARGCPRHVSWYL